MSYEHHDRFLMPAPAVQRRPMVSDSAMSVVSMASSKDPCSPESVSPKSLPQGSYQFKAVPKGPPVGPYLAPATVIVPLSPPKPVPLAYQPSTNPLEYVGPSPAAPQGQHLNVETPPHMRPSWSGSSVPKNPSAFRAPFEAKTKEDLKEDLKQELKVVQQKLKVAQVQLETTHGLLKETGEKVMWLMKIAEDL